MGLFTVGQSFHWQTQLSQCVETDRIFVTIEMKINFLAPVREGMMEAEARLLRRGRIVPAEVDIKNNGKLVAKAIATYIILGKDRI